MNIKNLFGHVKDERPKAILAPVVVTPVKSEAEIIEEIHASFDLAQDELLRQAQQVLAENVIPESQRLKAENLRRLGFTSTADVRKLNELDRKTDESKRIEETVVYYKQKYPFLKFLTIAELDKICNKFGLLHSQVQNYIGDVPDKNLQEIQDAQKLEIQDYPMPGRPAYFRHRDTGQLKKFNYQWEIYVDEPKILDEVSDKGDWVYDRVENERCYPHPAQQLPLSIAAPKAMFNTQGLVQRGNELVTKDPIVFRYVRGGIQVLSKWGLEASDPALINPINN